MSSPSKSRRHHDRPPLGRSVRHPCEGADRRSSLRASSPSSDVAPQRAARLHVQGLHLRPEARDDARDQARTAPQGRRRAIIGQLKAEHCMALTNSVVPGRPGRRRLRRPPATTSATSSTRCSTRLSPVRFTPFQPEPEFFTEDYWISSIMAWSLMVRGTLSTSLRTRIGVVPRVVS
jgi:hypothetical protein